MSFGDDVQRFAVRLEATTRELHAQVCEEAFVSVVDGSPLTGSEGQRVDTGFLKSSWRNLPLGPYTNLIGTPVAYAPIFEGLPFDPAGVGRPAEFKSRGPSVVGLRDDSVLLTRLGWQRIVDAVAQRVRRT